MRVLRRFGLLPALIAGLCLAAAAQEPVFSGPQVDEVLPPLSVRNIVGPQAGPETDPVAAVDGKPLLLIFVHKRERPAFALANALTKAAAEREAQGLRRQLVFLTDDPTTTESWLKQTATYFEKGTPVGISLDGAEGPGAYGLNRNVTMTVLVAREGKVTANFALVQPSLPADGPKILTAIWEATGGGEVPEITKFAPGAMRAAMRDQRTDSQDPKLRALLRDLIRTNASADEVATAGKAVEEYISSNEAARMQLGQIARRVVNGPRFGVYGTAPAREKLKAWADQYGAAAEPSTRSDAAPSTPPAGPSKEDQ